MAARLSQRHQDRFRRLGLAPMRPEVALRLMDRAIQQREPLLVPMRIDDASIRGKDAEALARLLFVTPPRPAAAPGPEKPTTKQSLRDRLRAAGTDERARLLLELVRAEVAAVLKLPNLDNLHEGKRLDELGMDSLMAVDIRRRLETRLTMQLPATVVFDHPSCGELVQYLLEAMARTS
jgi:polyketide synthase 12